MTLRCRRFLGVSLVLALLSPPVFGQSDSPAKSRGFALFSAAGRWFETNRVQCGVRVEGEICIEPTPTSAIGGGFWPRGTANQYVFSSGPQVAGIIAANGGPWAGDTSGAFFFDDKGTTVHGRGITEIFSALDPDDLAQWPAAARVPGGAAGAFYHPSLVGRTSASEGDAWWLMWEGDTTLLSGRKHPLGLLVEVRVLGWNIPSGNQDILYVVTTYYNITSLQAADYAAVRPELRSILLQYAQRFHAENNQRFQVMLPTGGYTIESLHLGMMADFDVGDAGQNYATVHIPLSLNYAYANHFGVFPGWTFDPGIFTPPFQVGTGLTGIQFLRSDLVSGDLRIYSNVTGGGGDLNSARNVPQLYRYLSGTTTPLAGDGACNFNPLTSRLCFIRQTSAADLRSFHSTGPFSLDPGEFETQVSAYLFAAPVATGGSSTCPTCDIKPGVSSIIANQDDPAIIAGGMNPIDSIAGFLGANDASGDGILQGDEFLTVPRSLYGKAQVAQAIFENGFLLPSAPAAPDFFLIPGDSQVTVMWRPSTSEQTGDPYFTIAQSAQVMNDQGALVANPLYDPNFREFDVEGYRIYRSRVDAPASMALIARFDYAGTVISDYAGQVNPSRFCAPEVSVTSQCPVAYDPVAPGQARSAHVDVPLMGTIIQVRFGDRLALTDGTALHLHTDTIPDGVTPNGFPNGLADTGVPFAWVDTGLRNNFRYFYTVIAFDVNSLESGPASFESPRVLKSVTPVRPASNHANTVTFATHILGRGVAMDTIITVDPTIDPVTGVFSGPQRPANSLTPAFVGFVKEVIAAPGVLSIRMDSITPGEADEFSCCGGVAPGQPAIYHFTVHSGGNRTVMHLPLTMNGNSTQPATASVNFDAVTIDGGLASRFGASGPFTLKGAAHDTMPSLYLAGAQTMGCRFKGGPIAPGLNDCIYNGHRWRNGPTVPTSSPLPADRILPETFPDPNSANCNHDGGNGPVCQVVDFNNGGQLVGVSTIHVPQSYTQLIRRWRNVEAVLGPVFRAADMNVYWGAGGVVDSVIDVTHNVVVPFDSEFGASWGILNANNPGTFGSSDTRPTVLTANDFTCVYPINGADPNNPILNPTLDPANAYPCNTSAFLEPQITLGSVAFYKDAQANAIGAPVSGTGFMFYITGTVTMFQLSSLPAAGTVWTVRTYSGIINGGNGIGGGNKGPYSFRPAIRPMTIIGAEVQVVFDVTNQVNAPTVADLEAVHTVPDPYYLTNAFEEETGSQTIKFVNLPQDAVIRIYSSSGVLVTLLEHHSTTFGGAIDWNVRNRTGRRVASGVYFYHLEAGNARRVGRFTIVNDRPGF
jgi:hypothetical protein